jgi:hypothetical protein
VTGCLQSAAHSGAGDVEIATAFAGVARVPLPSYGDAWRLQLQAFRLTLDSIRSARPAAVTTPAACALSARSKQRAEMGRMHLSRWKQNSGLGASAPTPPAGGEAQLPCTTPVRAVDADLPASFRSYAAVQASLLR